MMMQRHEGVVVPMRIIPPSNGAQAVFDVTAGFFFLARFNQEFSRNIRGFTEAATAALNAHGWPGNVRELENRMKRAVVMADKRMIDAADLELAETDNALADLDLRAARVRAEREVIQAALARSNNTLTVAARMLGISRPTLYGLMQTHGLDSGISKPADPAMVVETDAGREANIDED